MAFLAKARKEDLMVMTEELGCEVNPEMRICDLKKAIETSENYEAEWVRLRMEVIIEERKEKAQAEKEERLARAEREERLARAEREERLAKEQAEREERIAREQGEREERIAMERLRLEARASTPDRTLIIPNPPVVDIRKVMREFNPDESEISLYLTMFERQAKRINLDTELWVTHLMRLLPMEIGQMVLREAADEDNYYKVKHILLDRFRMSPEAFHQKFLHHQRRPGDLWRDYVYESQTFIQGRLNGLKVTDFEALVDLIVTDQLKRKLGPEMRDHFLDNWDGIIKPLELAEMADRFELLKKPARKMTERDKNQELGKAPIVNRYYPEKEKGKISEQPGAKMAVPKREVGGWRSEERNRSPIKNSSQNKDFETRRSHLTCWECGSTQHLRNRCPRLEPKRGEILNSINLEKSVEETMNPFISTIKVNGRTTECLRDSGASMDIVCQNLVSPSDYLGENVWVKQPLDNYSIKLPLARVRLEGDFGEVYTKACVISPKLNQKRYILGNRTAELIREKTENFKLPEEINALTRTQKRLLENETDSGENAKPIVCEVPAAAIVRRGEEGEEVYESAKRDESAVEK